MKRLLTLVVLLAWTPHSRAECRVVCLRLWCVRKWGLLLHLAQQAPACQRRGRLETFFFSSTAGSNVYLLSDPLANGGYANFDIGEAQGTLSLVSGGPTGSYYTASGANWWIFAPNLPFLGTNCTFYGVGPNYTGNWNWTAQNPVWSSVTVVGGGSQNFFNLSGSGSWIVWSKGNGCVGTGSPQHDDGMVCVQRPISAWHYMGENLGECGLCCESISL